MLKNRLYFISIFNKEQSDSMSIEETLLRFEKKYMFLYEIEVNGFPVYTCFRDRVNLLLSGEVTEKKVEYEDEKGREFGTVC